MRARVFGIVNKYSNYTFQSNIVNDQTKTLSRQEMKKEIIKISYYKSTGVLVVLAIYLYLWDSEYPNSAWLLTKWRTLLSFLKCLWRRFRSVTFWTTRRSIINQSDYFLFILNKYAIEISNFLSNCQLYNTKKTGISVICTNVNRYYRLSRMIATQRSSDRGQWRSMVVSTYHC